MGQINMGHFKNFKLNRLFMLTVVWLFSLGAMAIVGAIQDGILNDYTTLAVKSVLDFIIVAVMTSSMGKGSAFSAIPIFFFEGTITILARLISPIMTDLAINYLSLIGSILIFCVGINLVWGKKLRVANMLPAVVLAVWLLDEVSPSELVIPRSIASTILLDNNRKMIPETIPLIK